MTEQRPLKPGTGEEATGPPPSLPEVRQQTILIPESSSEPDPPPPKVSYLEVDEEEGGCTGCLWGLGGVAGCLVLGVVVIASLLFVGGKTVESFIAEFTGIFQSGPARIEGIFVPVVERVQELSELTTVRFNYANIVTSQTEMPPLLGALYGNSQVMVAVGHIEAGIDLSQLSEDDLTYDAETNTMTINLPAPRVTNCFLNESDSYIVSRSTGVFAAPSPTLDTESRRYALRQFYDMAIEDDILTEAHTQAEVTLRSLIELFSDPGTTFDIVFTSEAPELDTQLPEPCG